MANRALKASNYNIYTVIILVIPYTRLVSFIARYLIIYTTNTYRMHTCTVIETCIKIDEKLYLLTVSFLQPY